MSWSIPNRWCAVSIGEITRDTEQRVPSAREQFTYIDIASVNRDTKAIESPQRLLGADAPSRARKAVRAGDVLVSMTRPNLNAVAMVPPTLDGQIASTGFDVLRGEGVDPRWLLYLVRSTEFVQNMSDLVQGALYPAIRSKDIRGFRVPLAPLPEQKRIADKLDTLLARVDACRARLDRVPALLKRFRQAALAAAMSGTLSAEWRERNPNPQPWRCVHLADLGKLGRGKSKHRPRNDPLLYGGTYAFIQTGDIANSGGVITRHSQTYSELARKFHQ